MSSSQKWKHYAHVSESKLQLHSNENGSIWLGKYLMQIQAKSRKFWDPVETQSAYYET